MTQGRGKQIVSVSSTLMGIGSPLDPLIEERNRQRAFLERQAKHDFWAGFGAGALVFAAIAFLSWIILYCLFH